MATLSKLIEECGVILAEEEYENGAKFTRTFAKLSQLRAALADRTPVNAGVREALDKLRDAPLSSYLQPIEPGDYHYSTQDDMTTAMGMGRDLANGIFDAVAKALAPAPSEGTGAGG